MNILLIEDNLSIIKGLAYSFSKNNLNLIYKLNLKQAHEYLKNNENIDLIILDINLKDGSGLDFYEKIIKNLQIPTIFLTVLDDEETIVKCLENGAEDYIVKPFGTKELLARVNKVLFRAKKMSIIKIQDITFDLDKVILYKNKQKISLTALELKLINLLFNNLGKTVSRNTILDKIWEWTGNYVDDHTITVYFKRIREKIKTNIIETVKGIGYRIDEK